MFANEAYGPLGILQGLEEQIKAVRPKLVVLDPLYSAGSTEDYMARTAEQMFVFKRWRDTYNCSFLVVHHTKKNTEVGIMRVDKSNLMFVFPPKLHNVGSIPLNNSTSVAVRTANSRRAEVINNFAQAKHTSVFEAVELSQKSDMAERPDYHLHVIQKLMSAPVVGASGAVGVIQVSKKGPSAPAVGPDFTPTDLQKLVACVAALVKCFK